MDLYQDYPKVMRHPQHRPAVPYKQPRHRPGEEGYGQTVNPASTGAQPEKFPDVTVRNKDQEQYYAALGYTPAGVSNPEAYRRAMTGNEAVPADKFMRYPMYLYRVAKDAVVEEGVELAVDSRLVNTKAEEDALGSGWHPNPGAARAAFLSAKKPPAQAPKAAQAAAEPGPDRKNAPKKQRKKAKRARKVAKEPAPLAPTHQDEPGAEKPAQARRKTVEQPAQP